MDYPCGKFDDCSFIRYFELKCGQTDRQTDMQNHSHTERDADDRLILARL